MFYKESEIVQELVTDTIRLRLLQNSIIHYTFLKGVEIDIEQHKANFVALKNISKNEKHLLLIDSLEFVNVTSKARKYIRELESQAPILARAVVTESLANKLLIRFYNNIHKPIYPLKIFTNYESAQNWLLSLNLAAH